MASTPTTAPRGRELAPPDAPSAEVLRTLFDGNPDGILVVTAERRILLANPTMGRMLGCDPRDLQGLSVADLHPADALPKVLDHFARLAERPDVMAPDIPVLRRDGRVFTVDIRANRVTIGGEPCVVGMFRDVSDRERARAVEDALARREEIFSSIVSQAGEAVALVDGTTGGFLEFNAAAHEGLGYTREAFARLTVADIQAEHSPEWIRENFERAGRGGIAFETRHRHRDGSVRDVRVSARGLRHQGRDCMAAVWMDITDRRQAERDLEFRNVLLTTQQESSIDAILVVDAKDRVLSCNRKFREMWGLTCAADAGDRALPVWDLMAAKVADGAAFVSRVAEIEAAAQETSHDDVRLDDGRILERYSAPMAGQGDAYYGRIWYFRDATERRRREAYHTMAHEVLVAMSEPGELRASLQRVLAIVRRVADVDAVALRLQDGDDFPYYDHVGFAPAFLASESRLAAAGSDDGRCTGPGGLPRLPCVCGLVLSGDARPPSRRFTRRGSAWTNEAFADSDLPPSEGGFRLRGGCLRHGYVSIALVPIRGGGTVLGLLQLNDRRRGRFTAEVIGSLEDMADSIGEALLRKQAEADLLESRERLDHVIGAAQDAIIMMGADGTISLWNESATTLLGYTREEAIGQRLHELLAPERFLVDFERASPVFRETGMGGAIGRSVDLSARRKDGTEVPVELSLSPLNLAGAWHAVGILRDTSERKRLEAQHEQMEAQLRQVQKLEGIGQLAGGVAHDFNNILAAIMMALGLLEMKPDLDEETRSRLADVTAEVRRAADLTRQLLMFSRRSVLAAKPLDLNDIVANLLKMLGRLIPEHIELVFDRAGRLPLVTADAGLLEQVVMNLVVNARDAMPRGGRVAISTRHAVFGPEDVEGRPNRRVGHVVCLTVSDTGSGIEPALLKRVFEPFFTTKEAGKGTGLGLATVDGIVAQHRGWVEVESEVGRGTAFKVFLPASDATVCATEGDREAAPVSGGAETVLVVEDDERVRRSIVRALRGLGYVVFEAASGQAAVAVWQASGGLVDLLLTDMVMPEGMTGLELSERLQALQPGLKVIVSSGYSAEIVQAGVPTRAGVVYLPKPYDNRMLARVVRRCLDQRGDGRDGSPA